MVKVKSILLSLLLVFLSLEVSGQSLLPKMKISQEKNANPMVLQELHTDVYVVGKMAVTTMEMVFYNPNNRVMEGEFEFPLGDGQEVSRFALDINGKLREGVVVDKAKGRKVFENIVRRGVDPGLLEKTEGNNFKARVYPMPAKGTRRILIAFEQELSQKGEKDFYFLPIKNSYSLKKFSLKVDVLSREVEVDLANSLELDFRKWKNSYHTEVFKTNYTLDKDIALYFQKMNKLQSIVASDNEKTYFYTQFLSPKEVSKEKVLPRKIGILWDTSSSAQKRNFDKEYKLLDEYFGRIKNVEVQVKTFNIKASAIKTFSVRNGNWEALKSFLKEIKYDGATDVSAISFDQKNDEFLVFTDGIFNFGKEIELSSLIEKAHKPVYTINSNVIANASKLKYLSLKTGGNYVDLTNREVEEALKTLLEIPLRLINVEVKLGKVVNVYPQKGSVIQGKDFVAVGELVSDRAELEFYFGYGNSVEHKKRVVLTKDVHFGDKEFSLLRRVWAEKKIDQMKTDGVAQKEIDEVGKEFGIVTEGTSLIVLEEISDYVLHRILPPIELQKEYFSLLTKEEEKEKEEARRKEKQREENIEKVLNDSKKQTEWWETNYPIYPKKEKVTTVVEERAVAARASAEGYQASPVSQAPSVSQDNAKEIEQVVVVGYQAKSKKTSVSTPKEISVQINEFNPDTPYAKVLEYSDEKNAYETYLKLKEEYGQTPAFYVDAANYFFKKDKKDIATRIISNLAELNLEDVQLLRILGYKLLEFESKDYAIATFRKVLKLKGEEPQSYRDLGLALAQNREYNEAIENLYKVVTEEWDVRFRGVQLIAMNEINNIIQTQKDIDVSFIDKRLIKKEPVDIRVVLTWDTDNSDMDLWVTDPEDEVCKYSNKLTRLGGKISNDLTRGYGPEEFMIKKATKGKYKIQVNYYVNRSQKQLFPVSLRIEFFTNYGKPQQKKQEVTVRLSDNNSTIDVGEFIY